MRILVDTHVLLWAAVADPRLRGRAFDLFVDPGNALVVSVTSLWEIAIKYSLGKLPLPVLPADFIAREIAARGYHVLDVRREHAERVSTLPFPAGGHRDPFDRLLVAQALTEGIPILTGDRRLADYTVAGLVLAADAP